MARDGTSNPFDGSGGTGSGSNWTYKQGTERTGPGPTKQRDVTMVPPGGLMPPTAPPNRPGETVSPDGGLPGGGLPIRLGG